MNFRLLFWVLMLLWLVLGIWGWGIDRARWQAWGGSFLLWILLLMLGWHVFGQPITP
ncbi:MAG TPA: hypothetical protein VK797_23290 [Tepidisphaeraceae bacterium]|jgi:hypothetical protein|nr:hypothetical protein [Tepidisphaeraceae bacterium]